MRLPLDLAGEIEALIAGQTVQVTAQESAITVDFPSLRAALLALRGTGGRRRRKDLLMRVAAALRVTDLELRIRLAGGLLARLGAGTRPGPISRLLGLEPLEIRLPALWSLLRALFRSGRRRR